MNLRPIVCLLCVSLVPVLPGWGETSSSISLASSANPAILGRAVTLTATVAPAATSGAVTFYDGAVVLGTSNLRAGTATLTTSVLASGKRALTAYYSGSSVVSSDRSGVVYESVVSLPQGGFGPVANYNAGSGTAAIALGDFNGDGKADLAVANYFGSSVSILLGKGDGTFESPLTFPTNGSSISIVAADFNGDGKTDLAVANNIRLSETAGTVSILLGKGDGTFQPAVQYAAGGAPGSVAAGDFNGDGKTDLVVANSIYNAGTVSVLLGDGEGNFQAAVAYPVGSVPKSVAVGDFNEDGHPDIVVTNYWDNNAGILLGRGDGMFAAEVTYGTDVFPVYAAIGDFNGDGHEDLAVANPVGGLGEDGDVSVLLGKGDGSFQPAVTYSPTLFGTSNPWSTAFGADSVIVADMNGDGIADLAVFNGGSPDISILPGNGDGTFGIGTNYAFGPVGESAQPGVVGDFNGDGIPDISFGTNDTAASTVGVMLGVPQGPLSQTIAFPTLSDLTQWSINYTAPATASSGLATIVVSNTPQVCGSGEISGLGTCSLTALQPGNSVYAPAPQVTRTFQVAGPAITAITPLFSSSTSLEPGSWISIFGSDLAHGDTLWNGNFPTILGGVSVEIGYQDAYLSYVSPGQINLQVPDHPVNGSVTVVSTDGVARQFVGLASVSPSFSLFADDKHVAAEIATPDGTGAHGGGAYDFAGPTGAFDFATRPVRPGEILILYGVGFGPTNPAVPAGAPFSGSAPTTNPVQIWIGGVQATVAYSGIVETGLYQFNVTVPSLPSGDQSVVAEVAGVQTSAGPVVAIR